MALIQSRKGPRTRRSERNQRGHVGRGGRGSRQLMDVGADVDAGHRTDQGAETHLAGVIGCINPLRFTAHKEMRQVKTVLLILGANAAGRLDTVASSTPWAFRPPWALMQAPPRHRNSSSIRTIARRLRVRLGLLFRSMVDHRHSTVTMRQRPHRCAFTVLQQQWGRRHRRRTAGRVAYTCVQRACPTSFIVRQRMRGA